WRWLARGCGFPDAPRFSIMEAGLGHIVHHGDGKSALQSGFVLSEYLNHLREVTGGKCILSAWCFRNDPGLGSRILGGIGRKKFGHCLGIFTNLLYRPRKPLVDRAIHQAVGKERKKNNGSER